MVLLRQILPLIAMFFATMVLLTTDVAAWAQASDTTPTTAAEANDPLPVGLLARLGTTRYRPAHATKALAFLPDNKTLAVISEDGCLRHWDARSGRKLHEIRLMTGRSIASAETTAAGAATVLRGWRLDEPQRKNVNWLLVIDNATGLESSRTEFDDLGEAAAVSPDKTLVAGASSGAAFVADATSGSQLATWKLNRNETQSWAFSPNGKILAIGSRGKVFLWNWGTEAEPKSIAVALNRRRAGAILSLAFAPDGSQLCVGSDSQNGVFAIDVAAGKVVRHYEAEGVVSWYPRHLAISADGKLLAAPIADQDVNSGAVAIWERESGKLLRKLDVPYGSMNTIAFSHDGKLLAAAGHWDNTLYVWNTDTWQRNGADQPGHLQAPSELAFFPGDDRLASAGEDGTIRIWDIPTSRELHVLEGDSKKHRRTPWVRAMDVSSDGKFIASSCLDDTVRLWDAATGREIYRLPGHGDLGGRRAVRFTPDSKYFASWGDDMRVYLWDVATGKARQDYRAQPTGVTLPDETDRGHDRFEFSLDGGYFSPDASRLVLLVNSAHVFDTAGGKELFQHAAPKGHIVSTAISPDNQYLLTFSWGQGRQIQLADGRMHFTSGENHPLQLRKLDTGDLVKNLTFAEGGAGPVAISSDGKQAAVCVGDFEPTIYLATIPDLKIFAQTEPLLGRVRAISFSGSGKRLAGSTSDGNIQVWDVAKLKPAEIAEN